MAAQSLVSPAVPRNLAAIDAADLGLDFIDNCVMPLTRAMRHLPDDSRDWLALNDLLAQQAVEYRALLGIIREREER